MRILCILSTTSIHGGSTRAFLSYSSLLIEKYPNIELIVACPNQGSAYKILKQKGISVYIIPNRFHIYPSINNIFDIFKYIPKLLIHWYINTKAISKLKKICTKHNPDIIYTNVGVLNIGFRTAKKYKIPHIYHLREYQNVDFGMKIIPSFTRYTRLLKTCKSICITKGIQKHFNLTNIESRVIYDGVRYKKEKVYIEEKENYFLFVGRIEKAKGIDLILNSFADFCKTNADYRLKIIGASTSKSYELSILNQINKLSICDRVDLLGVKENVNDFMQRAIAIIVASPFEGFGMVTAEAMYNGCLVIGRNTAGTKEQLDNGAIICGKEIGLRFNTEKELTAQMRQVVKKGCAYYKDMIHRAQNVVTELYSIENCTESIYNYFKEIIENETPKY